MDLVAGQLWVWVCVGLGLGFDLAAGVDRVWAWVAGLGLEGDG